jgi:predicted DNA-binding transcriptional regulator YafY
MRLLSRKRTTAKALADRFEVSTRTVYRYLETLDMAGVPIVTEKGYGGGIGLTDDFRVESNFFTPDEYAYLMTALESLKTISPAQAEGLSDKLAALSKIAVADRDTLLSASTLRIDGGGWVNQSALRGKLQAVSRGLSEQKILRIEYYDAELNFSAREVEPHLLILREGFYLYAYCRLRDEFRHFRLARIKSVVVTGEGFTRRPITESPAVTPTGTPVTLTLQFDEEARMEVEEWLGYDAVRGSAATAEVNLSRAVVAKILGLGRHAKVLGGEQIKVAVTAELDAMRAPHP